jgi:hypothetical protein
VRCTLAIDNVAVFVAQGGPPEVEYALFEAGESELRATEPGTIREVGYRTSAGLARARLDDAGITAALADRAASAARPAVVRAYARSPAARCVVARLEASEVLESLAYDAATGRYTGTWLDLTALATDVGVAGAAGLLRALYLAAFLAALPEDSPVVLDTSALAAQRRAGERTYRRVVLDGGPAVVDALGALKPVRGRSIPADTGPGKGQVIAWLRARAERTPAARERLEAIEASLGTREPPTRGPLAETALWNVEAKLSRGEPAGMLDQIDAIERRRGRVPGTMYLRARIALMTGTEDARSVAERVAALSGSMAAPFPELELLAAQAWAAAGDTRRARAFARDLQDNATADDGLRLQAVELLDSIGAASSGALSGSGRGSSPEGRIIEPKPILSVHRGSASEPASSRGRDAHARADAAVADVVIPKAPRAPSGTALDSAPEGRIKTSTRPGFPAAPTHPSATATLRSLPPGISLPPYRIEPRGGRSWSSPPPVDSVPEPVEMLPPPDGLNDAPLPTDELPRSPPAARVMCTFLARELARELRLRHSVELRSDVDGLEIAQRYLRELLVDGRVRTTEERREVLRNGAFLAELLARRLAGRWVDLDSKEPGRWAMLVPSRSRQEEVARVWPFARVLRFVAMGHRERDLVAYYLELEARSR